MIIHVPLWSSGAKEMDKDTKVTGDLKAGSKVEVKYVINAVSVEVKGEPKKVKSLKK